MYFDFGRPPFESEPPMKYGASEVQVFILHPHRIIENFPIEEVNQGSARLRRGQQLSNKINFKEARCLSY